MWGDVIDVDEASCFQFLIIRVIAEIVNDLLVTNFFRYENWRTIIFRGQHGDILLFYLRPICLTSILALATDLLLMYHTFYFIVRCNTYDL